MKTAEQMIKEALANIEQELQQAQRQQMQKMTQDFHEMKSALLTLPRALTNLSDQQKEQLQKYSTIADVTKKMNAIEKQQVAIAKEQQEAAARQETLSRTLSQLRTELATFTQLMKKSD